MFNWLLNRLQKYDITKTVDGVETLYLRRWFLLRSKYLNVYIHYIARPDEDPDPHDHPWNFLSVRLKGGYTERIWHYRTPCEEGVEDRTNNAPGIGYRPAETVHQITSVKPNTFTLVITGPWKRDWGFLTKSGWRFWREYLNCWEKVEMD